MIARHETHVDKIDIWSALAAPFPPASSPGDRMGAPSPATGVTSLGSSPTSRRTPFASASTPSCLANGISPSSCCLP